MEAGTTGSGGGERSLSVGVGMHEDALQQGQHLDQVLGAGRKSNRRVNFVDGNFSSVIVVGFFLTKTR